MKILKLILFIFSVSPICAQSSGKAIYEKKWINPYTKSSKGQELKKEDPKVYEEYLQMEQEQNELTNQLSFSLEFNKEEAIFSMEEIMVVDQDAAIGKMQL